MNQLKHLAVILDGNRRFAKRLMLEPWKGHEFGKKKVEELIEWCIESGIKELTLYSFSMQNFNRPKEEFNYLMKLIKDAFTEFESDDRVSKYRIKLNVIGRYELFPDDVVEIMNKVQEKTKNNSGFIINFAMAYGGREEIIDGIKKLIQSEPHISSNISNIDESLFSKYLYLQSEPDLIIRTGGDRRTSNFLPWQSIYSELLFLEKSWPEFTKEDFTNALDDFNNRERRFGK